MTARLLPHLVLVIATALTPFAARAQSGASADQQAPLTAAQKDSERKARLAVASDALAELYAKQPDTRKAVTDAAGYAVFDITSIYALLYVAQKGTGVLMNNKTGKPTFMEAVRAGTGPGLGFQKIHQVIVFKTAAAMDQFTLAGGLGGDVSAAVSVGTEGGVRFFNPDISI